MASKVQEARTATTPRVAPFLAGAAKGRLWSRTFDGCKTYIGPVVTMGEEGAQMFAASGGLRPFETPLPTANRGYIR